MTIAYGGILFRYSHLYQKNQTNIKWAHRQASSVSFITIILFYDGQQPVQCPPLHHSFKGVQLDADDWPSFPDQFIDPAGVTVSDAAPPADRSKEWKSALATTDW